MLLVCSSNAPHAELIKFWEVAEVPQDFRLSFFV